MNDVSHVPAARMRGVRPALEAVFDWLHRFENRDHAFRVIGEWLERYDRERPHSALGYLTPREFRERLAA